jgi:DNA-binding NtrC family response regulator
VSDYLAGDHPRLDAVRTFAEKVARVPNASVLITGEPGTGKSCLARAIHALSGAGGRFVEVSCAALSPGLVGAGLFGPDTGVDAAADAPGPCLAETGARGTLFLKEVGALPLAQQAKLLTLLDSGRVGGSDGADTVSVTARIVAAASHDLRAAAARGTFRSDLLCRLEVASVHMPPLREMPEVVGQLVARFAAQVADRFRQPQPPLSPAATAQLLDYDWPGNVRELRNVVERAMVFYEGGPLEVTLPSPPSVPAEEAAVVMPPGLTLEEVQTRYLVAALRRSRGDYAGLASRLGISRKTLWDKRRRLGLDVSPTR